MTEPPPQPPVAAIPPGPLTEEERNLAMWCHLLGILTAVTLGMGFLGPLVLWLMKKDESAFVDFHGKEALNFQITTFLVIVSTSIVAFILMFVFIGFLLIPVIFIIGILALVAEIMACLAAQRGEWHRYPACIRFVV